MSLGGPADLVVALVLATAMLAGSCWALVWVLDPSGRSDRGRRLAHRLHLVGSRPPAPTGRPLEAIAADLRRIRGLLDGPRAGTFAVRSGTLRAYDQVLAEACQALGVEHRLGVPGDLDDHVERLRTEAQLERAGLVLRGPPREERRAG